MSLKSGLSGYEKIRDQVFLEYSKISYVPLQSEAISHTSMVDGFAALLACRRNLDAGLLKTAALLHDYARFAKNQNRSHALLSARHARGILEDTGEFSPSQVDAICQAIALHSAKEQTDGPLAEALKDADLLASWSQNPTEPLDAARTARLQSLFEELAIPQPAKDPPGQ